MMLFIHHAHEKMFSSYLQHYVEFDSISSLFGHMGHLYHLLELFL
ncbi:MAG: hypothetical protein Q8P95_04560 [bacterium]|nr:hypothetical protein [bacterium]